MELTAFVCGLLLALVTLVSGEVNDTKKDTIVIHTPLQNYDRPSLRDYEECQANRESCRNTCAGSAKCELECPLCPELTDEPLLVQGVNDTSYVAPAAPAVNTTNIIKLTNEISNIIKHDIQSRNEVNVKVHQNVSQVGGRFGLGFNEQGSCCYVVRRERDCEDKEHCVEHSRHRVCGARCVARVMHAKRVVVCKKDQSEECYETVEFVPARRHKSKPRKHNQNTSNTQLSQCNYVNNWPFVSCNQDQSSTRIKRNHCQYCMELAYGYILQYGLPVECSSCFGAYNVAPMLPTPIMYPVYRTPGFGFSNRPLPMDRDQFVDHDKNPDTVIDYDKDKVSRSDNDNDNAIDSDDDDGWVLQAEKCYGPSGQLVDCVEGSGDVALDRKPLPPAHLEEGSESDYDDYYKVPAQRRRRSHGNHKFVRSLYSRRNAQ